MVSAAWALYEDQIGKFDWRRELVGYPQLTAFEEVKGPSEYITVYTNLGILASLSVRDGTVRTNPFVALNFTFHFFRLYGAELCLARKQ